MREKFKRSEMILGKASMEKLKNARVAVFGIGGVGGFATEALARTGVGKLIIVDNDTVSESNINRQIIADTETIGKPKTQAMRERLLKINPELEVVDLYARYEAATREEFFKYEIDYIVDCIDIVTSKLDLIQTAIERNIPIISAMGTGNKIDPTKLQITDISKTINCPLAKVMRKELRTRGIRHHKVVYSPELAMKTQSDEELPQGRRSIPGSVIWVPATAGLIMASKVIEDIGANKDD